MAEKFTFFWKSRLSQWHPSAFTLCGISFTCAEQYMMYAKARLFGDRDAAERILASKGPEEHQAIGRMVEGFDETIWVLFREGIAFAGNYARFSQDSAARELLFKTNGTTLVEVSPYDRVWGIGLAADDPRSCDRARWLGLNLLGEALTRVRQVLIWEHWGIQIIGAEVVEGGSEA